MIFYEASMLSDTAVKRRGEEVRAVREQEQHKSESGERRSRRRREEENNQKDFFFYEFMANWNFNSNFTND